MLFVNGEQFRREPSVEMKKMESFLNLEPFIKEEHFVMKNEVTSKVKCMSGDKGRKHPSIDASFLNKLKELYRPYN
jgi:[heparan sulfate]-glucosamine 3-sulfotransferase 3